MSVFLTGSSGFVGTGVARALLARGHEVVGLARSRATGEALRRSGVETLSGDLADGEVLRRGAGAAEAVVHAGFPRDAFERFAEAVALERSVVGALLDGVAGTGKPLLYTSGIGVIGDTGGEVVDEDAPVHTPPSMGWRKELEQLVLETGNGVVVRPALVYGRGGNAILRTIVRVAQERGASSYAGDGQSAWPNVHVDDLGEAYALALERAPAGTVLNLAGGEATPRSVAEAVGRLIGAPERTSSLPTEEAEKVLPFAGWIGTSIRVDTSRSRGLLGWRPVGPDLLEDLEFGSYRALVGAQNEGRA